MDTTIRTRRWARIAAAAALATLAVGGVAAAQAQDTQFTGCLKNGKVDEVAIGDAPEKACKNNETQITWSATGPQGPEGPTGPQGEVGPQGAQGPAGQDGTSVAAQQCATGTYLVGFDAGGSLLCETVTQLTSPNGLFAVSVSNAGVAVTGPGGSLRVDGDALRMQSDSRIALDGGRIELNGTCDALALDDFVEVFMADADGDDGEHYHVAHGSIEVSEDVVAC